MNMLSKIKFIIYSLILISVMSGCSANKISAEKILKEGNYPLAVEEFDKDIQGNPNGYFRTISENGRSEAYYQLALKAIEKENYSLAIRFLYLANSDKADEEMIRCYEILADRALKNNQKDKVMGVYTYIIQNLYHSPRIPEFMYKRLLGQYEWYGNKDSVWEQYKILFKNYPDNKYVDSSKVVVDYFLKEKIDSLIVLKYTEPDPNTIIDSLFNISRYPTTYKLYIYQEISKIYVQMAELNINQRQYVEADANFRKAVEYDHNQTEYVNMRLRNVCDLFVKHGNTLLDKKQIDEAISFYQRAFTIIPEYPLAQEAIKRAEKKKEDIRRAVELKEEGLQLDRKKKYKEALEIFKKAYLLDNTDELAGLIFEMNNIIEIEKDPKTFALNVINNYQKGIIPAKVNALRKQLQTQWGKDLKDSGWKIIGSATRYKMEIRYDFMTPEDNFFLSWQVNMKDKTVIPLNKLTEKIVGK